MLKIHVQSFKINDHLESEKIIIDKKVLKQGKHGTWYVTWMNISYYFDYYFFIRLKGVWNFTSRNEYYGKITRCDTGKNGKYEYVFL